MTPEKKEDDFINNAMSSIYSVGHKFLNESCSLMYFSSLLTCFSVTFFQGWNSFTVGASKFASIAKDNVSLYLLYNIFLQLCV